MAYYHYTCILFWHSTAAILCVCIHCTSLPVSLHQAHPVCPADQSGAGREDDSVPVSHPLSTQPPPPPVWPHPPSVPQLTLCLSLSSLSPFPSPSQDYTASLSLCVRDTNWLLLPIQGTYVCMGDCSMSGPEGHSWPGVQMEGLSQDSWTQQAASLSFSSPLSPPTRPLKGSRESQRQPLSTSVAKSGTRKWR